MIACFLSNISAKYYKNPSMLSRVIAKNVGDVFLRHSVDVVRQHFAYYRAPVHYGVFHVKSFARSGAFWSESLFFSKSRVQETCSVQYTKLELHMTF